MAPTPNESLVRTPAESLTGRIAELPIDGMTCSACVGHVEKALRATPGVLDATVNLVTRRGTVLYDPQSATPASLAVAIEAAGYRVPTLSTSDRASERDEAESREHSELRRDFLYALALTLPLLVIGMSHGLLPSLHGTAGRWLQLTLATVVVLGPGRRFFRAAWASLRHRIADMNTLVSMGAGAAFLYSTVAVVAPGLFPHGEHGHLAEIYFEATGAILTFVLLGKLLEARARKRLSDAVRALVALRPKTARRVRNDIEEDVDAESLLPGDVVRVRPGERIATDGEIIDGSSAIDESMLTGESMPVDKSKGALVFGGTLNQSGAITLRVTRTGGETALARIVEAVEQAQGSKAPIARLADFVSGIFVPVVLGIATVTLIAWLLVDSSGTGVATAIERFVAVLVIACPCALGLATPAAVAVGTGRGAELGILFKGGAVLETASRVNTVLLDKTGTLTAGRPVLTDVVAMPGFDEARLLRLVASAESASEHPIARAVAAGAVRRGLSISRPARFHASVGGGVTAEVDGVTVRIGTAAFLQASGVRSEELESKAEALALRGRSPSFIALETQLAGLIVVRDVPSDDAEATVKELRAMGIEVVMVTGDREATARAVADELGIDDVEAGVRPEGKARVVGERRARGRVVAMVGDGINDAPALASADVGIAVSSGTDIAVAAADVALLRGGISRLPVALKLARATLRTVRQNLFWAFAYNVVGIPIAAGALYAWTGWQLSPVLASAAMSLSSVSVLLSSLRLRRFSAPTESPEGSVMNAAGLRLHARAIV